MRPDFESPGDSGRDNVYQVTVEVTDSENNTAERAVTVKVTNMEEAGDDRTVHVAAADWLPHCSDSD